MDNTAYVALSRQRTLRREVDIIANNVANVDTVGFKLESLMVRTEPARPARTAHAPNPVRFVLDNGVARNFGQGALRSTTSPFDVAVEGDGFFTVQTAEGERFTRDGRFQLDAEGRLVTAAGDPVLAEGGGEIVLDPRQPQMTVGVDGTITQGNVRVGRLGVVRFANLSALTKEGTGLYAAGETAEQGPANDSRIRQGMLEGSNVQPILEITNLMEVSRAYERVTRIVDSAEDLSRRSVERLGRVN